MKKPSVVAPRVDGERLLRLPEVVSKCGLRRSSIYEGMNSGTFPKSVPLGAHAVAWLSSEIDAWIAQRIAERKAVS
jgi:prophage regulatory protein